MSTWTKAQWATSALRRIGAIAANASASAEDQVLAESKADTIFKQLRRRSLAPFETSSIPEDVQGPVEAILAEAIAPHFGVSGESLVSLKVDARQARKDLAAVVATDPSPLPTEVDYF